MLAEPVSESLPPRVEELLSPIAADHPCGAPMRFDPVFTAIRLDREEDDPTLPMRQWERPLKVADWPSVERRAIEFLRVRSKDLQMAAWTLEAWFRQRELAGLCEGLQLLTGLLERYWDTVHPVIDEDGDCDARVAPFEWLNEELPVWLRTRVILARMPGYQPAVFTMADWLRLVNADTQREAAPAERKLTGTQAPEPQVPPVTRELLLAEIREGTWRQVVEQLQHTKACTHQVKVIDNMLKQRLGVQSPSLAKMTRELEVLERVLQQVLSGAELPHQALPAATASEEPTMTSAQVASSASVAPSALQGDSPLGAALPSSGSWGSREEAYRTLEAVADYLARTEPHSPTPYLIRRAVNWGRMSLPELMAEIQREEGDLNKLVNLLNAGYRDDAARY